MKVFRIGGRLYRVVENPKRPGAYDSSSYVHGSDPAVDRKLASARNAIHEASDKLDAYGEKLNGTGFYRGDVKQVERYLRVFEKMLSELP
jgi:hypothetical protein